MRENRLRVLTIVIGVCIVLAFPTFVQAEEVWSDDFDNLNYDGWTMVTSIDFARSSAWSASQSFLQIQHDAYGCIIHESSVSVGKWSFDVKTDTGTESGGNWGTWASVIFMCSDPRDAGESQAEWMTGYDVYLNTELTDNTVVVGMMRFGGPAHHETLAVYDSDMEVGGWHHIDVTRSDWGQITVYLNGTLVLQLRDTNFSTSEYFVFNTCNRQGLDNVVVDDTPPSGIAPEWFVIGIGASAVVVIAAVVYMKRR